jgi:hypothetical protein
MGRQKTIAPPVEPQFLRQAFAVTTQGVLIRRSTGLDATFRGPNTRQLVRVYCEGRIKRLVASKTAWIVHTGQNPRGVVRHRDGDEHNFAASNLIETKRGPRPFDQGKGGKASSLDRRANATTTLLQTLSAHPGSTVPQISKLVGSSTSCTCVRLSKLADAGLCVGPKCDARARWELSQQGRELAAQASNPVVLDQLARQVLSALALAPTRLLALARRVGCCSLTARRRVNLLVERKLIESDGRRFSITDEGRKALGDTAPQPWVRMELISAVNARDVRTRLQHPNDDRSSWARAEQSSRARQKGIEKARENGQQLFIDALTEFDRLRA